MHIVAKWEDLSDEIIKDLEFFLSIGFRSAILQRFISKAGNMSDSELVRQSFLQPGQHKVWCGPCYDRLHVIFRKCNNLAIYTHFKEYK